MNQRRINPAASYDKAVQAALIETGMPGFKEVLDYTFYDSVSVASAAVSTASLFSQPTTDLANSNFYGNGSMPAGQAFLCRTLRFIPAMGTATADVIAAMRGFRLAFMIENAKKYYEGLVQFLPSGIGPSLEYVAGTTASLSTGISTANNGVPAIQNVYRFTRPVVLRTLQPFQMSLTALAPTLVATTRFFIAMDGVLVRNTV